MQRFENLYRTTNEDMWPEREQLATEYGLDLKLYMALHNDVPTLRAWMQYGEESGAPEGFVTTLFERFHQQFGEVEKPQLGYFNLEKSHQHIRVRTNELLCFIELAKGQNNLDLATQMQQEMDRLHDLEFPELVDDDAEWFKWIGEFEKRRNNSQT